MTLSEFITLAKNTVLRQLKISDSALVAFINTGLLEVYKQFNISIKTNVTTFTTTTDKVFPIPMDLLSIVSVTTQVKYLRDNNGNLIEDTSNKEVELYINKVGNNNSIHTFSYNTFSYDFPVIGQTITIKYIAAPDTLNIDDSNKELPIHGQYVDPLLMYVAYLSNLSYGDKEQEIDLYLNRYRYSKDQILKLGLYDQNDLSDNRLDTKGFI